MTKYRFDWKDVIHGTIEIEAICGNDAEEKLLNMPLKDLLKNSNSKNGKIKVVKNKILYIYIYAHQYT